MPQAQVVTLKNWSLLSRLSVCYTRTELIELSNFIIWRVIILNKQKPVQSYFWLKVIALSIIIAIFYLIVIASQTTTVIFTFDVTLTAVYTYWSGIYFRRGQNRLAIIVLIGWILIPISFIIIHYLIGFLLPIQ